jgi:hypothetical protein
MKNVRKKISLVAMTLCVYFVSSCSLFDLDINKDPNNPAQASLSLLLTGVQLDASTWFSGPLNDATMGFVAVTTSSDDFNMTNSSWNGTWNFLYSSPLKDLDGMIKVTAQQRADGSPNPHYEGIAKVMKAYYFSLMVDLWGDVPYTAAFNGDAAEQELAPGFDGGRAIYENLLLLIDDALNHFEESSPVPVTGDAIYEGDVAQWAAAARSLKLRLLVQMRKTQGLDVTSQVAAIMDAADDEGTDSEGEQFLVAPLIGFATYDGDDANADFQFQFGALTNPDDRHPTYIAGYAGGDPAWTYFGHQYMFEMLDNNDPRRPFYFKRQTSTILNPDDATQKQTMPCSQRTDCIYGYFPISNKVAQGVYGVDAAQLSDAQRAFLAGFFGRDRSDPSGVPNDALFRTNVGVYPFGGLYDDGPERGGGNKGRGNGIFPMITSWMVKMYMLEAHLTLGVALPFGYTATDMFRDAVNEQFDKVQTLSRTLDAQTATMNAAARSTYIDTRVSDFNNAGGSEAKLRIMLKEGWFMNFGNGYEMYNAFRRTGYPSDIQLPLQTPRQFALRLPYALDEINLNANTPMVIFDSPANAIFWDELKFQF